MVYKRVIIRFKVIIFMNYLKQVLSSHDRIVLKLTDSYSALKAFTTIMLLLAVTLCFMTSITSATEVEMDGRVINLKSSIVKWMLALNDSPFVDYPNEPKLILATMVEEGTDDFACLLELNREFLGNGSFNNSIPVELNVQTTRSQQKELYDAFPEAADLKINWIFEDEGHEDKSWLQMEVSSLTLSLSNWEEMRAPSSTNWLGISQYSNIYARGKGFNESFIDSLSLVEKFHQRAGFYSPKTMSLSHRTMSCISDFWYEGDDVYQNLSNCSISTEQHKFSIATPRFGLGGLHIGLPFNSELIAKVDNYELSKDKTSTSLHNDFKQLLNDKPWLVYALTDNNDLDTQPETIQHVSYYIAYYRDEAFLKEYLDIIRRIESGEVKIVTPLKRSTFVKPAFKEMLKELGFSEVNYKSNGQSSGYVDRTAPAYRKITFIDPGFIANENAYNALLYFSNPLILVTGNIGLAKAITMNKIPFYEWRYFESHTNEHLQSFWQGTTLEAFFVSEYQPERKAAALNQFNFDSVLRRQTNQRIIKEKNAMPDLLDVIWLVHRPNLALWRLDKKVKERLRLGEKSQLFDEIKHTESADIRDVLAAKVLIQHILDQNTGYDSEQLDELIKLIQDPRLREYLISLMIKHKP